MNTLETIFSKRCFAGLVTVLLLSGCISGGDRMGPTSAKPILNPTPVAFRAKSKIAISDAEAANADLPAGSKSGSGTGAPQRLAILQATTRPVLPSKSSAFSSLTDGSLNTDEIKALFEGLKIRIEADGEDRRTYHFAENGTMEGWIYGSTVHHQADGMGFNDWGTWRVAKSARLCMDWFDWYSGENRCYQVSKKRRDIILRRDDTTLRYKILN